MSVEYYAACRSALPPREGGWSLDVGPVAISTMDLDDDVGREVLELVPGTVALVNFSSRAAGAEIGEGLSRLVARRLGGALVYEDGPEVLETFEVPAAAACDARALEAEMRAWLADARGREEEQLARAKAEWAAKTAADPKPKDDDWSDV